MCGKAKDNAEIEKEKEIIEMSTIQAMSKNRNGDLTKVEVEEQINKNAGNEEIEILEEGDNILVGFMGNDRYYRISQDGNVSGPVEMLKDKYPGDIQKDLDGNELTGDIDNPYEIWCIEDIVSFSELSRSTAYRTYDG